jgi:hypothetical protein
MFYRLQHSAMQRQSYSALKEIFRLTVTFSAMLKLIGIKSHDWMWQKIPRNQVRRLMKFR